MPGRKGAHGPFRPPYTPVPLCFEPNKQYEPLTHRPVVVAAAWQALHLHQSFAYIYIFSYRMYLSVYRMIPHIRHSTCIGGWVVGGQG